jgi:hypothetical protein
MKIKLGKRKKERRDGSMNSFLSPKSRNRREYWKKRRKDRLLKERLNINDRSNKSSTKKNKRKLNSKE